MASSAIDWSNRSAETNNLYPDFDSFFRVLVEAELLYPGMLDQMCVGWYMDDAEKEELREGNDPRGK